MAGTPLMRDHAGNIVWPAKTVRILTDPLMSVPAALPAWQTAAAGTPSFEAFNGAGFGRAIITSGATNGNAACLKLVSPLSAIKPTNYWAIGFTLEGLSMDTDDGYDFQMGPWNDTAVAGVMLQHKNGASTAVVTVRDASGVSVDVPIAYQVKWAAGGGRYRRNLTTLLLPRDGWFYVLEDDQVMAAVDLSVTNWVAANDTRIFAQIIVRDSAAHTMRWAQSRLLLVHN